MWWLESTGGWVLDFIIFSVKLFTAHFHHCVTVERVLNNPSVKTTLSGETLLKFVKISIYHRIPCKLNLSGKTTWLERPLFLDINGGCYRQVSLYLDIVYAHSTFHATFVVSDSQIEVENPNASLYHGHGMALFWRSADFRKFSLSFIVSFRSHDFRLFCGSYIPDTHD